MPYAPSALASASISSTDACSQMHVMIIGALTSARTQHMNADRKVPQKRCASAAGTRHWTYAIFPHTMQPLHDAWELSLKDCHGDVHKRRP